MIFEMFSRKRKAYDENQEKKVKSNYQIVVDILFSTIPCFPKELVHLTASYWGVAPIDIVVTCYQEPYSTKTVELARIDIDRNIMYKSPLTTEIEPDRDHIGNGTEYDYYPSVKDQHITVTSPKTGKMYTLILPDIRVNSSLIYGFISHDTLLLISAPDDESPLIFNLYFFSTKKWFVTNPLLYEHHIHLPSMWFDPDNNQVYCSYWITKYNQLIDGPYIAKLTLGEGGTLVPCKMSKQLASVDGLCGGVVTNGFGQQLLFGSERGRNVTALNVNTGSVETYGTMKIDEIKYYMLTTAIEP